MPTLHDPDTNDLLAAVSRGDSHARGPLLERHRAKLRKMVAIRLDRRIAARLDPSDIVQESLVEAGTRLNDYLANRQLPFYPWLRRVTSDRLADAIRRHLRAGRRSVIREEPPGLSGESMLLLANRIMAPQSGASTNLQRQELRDHVRKALAALPKRDRDVLVLRYLEDLSTADTAAVTGLSTGAVKMRLLRALQRLRTLLGGEDHP